MSVTLEAVNESLQGGQKNRRNKQHEELPSMTFGSLMDTAPPVAKREFVVFKLVKKPRGRKYVDSICDNVLNPKTGKRERVYLLNGVSTIWSSELTEQLKDKDFVSRNRRSLIFEDSVCRLTTEDATGIEYARVNRNNVGKQRGGAGKWDFYEYDPLEEAKARGEREDKEFDMQSVAKEMPLEKMRMMAAFFNVRFVDDFGIPVGDEAVRLELRRVAKRDPYLFEKYIGSDEVQVSWMIKRAIMEARIDLTGQTGNAIWADGKGFIAKIPSDRKHYEYLTELAMTNSDEGRRFREQLQSIL